jgi:hypothetical protein
MRIAIINKDGQQSCTVNINLGQQYCKQATLSRMLSPNGLLGKADITWQGQTYENAGYTGKLQGQQLLRKCRPTAAACLQCLSRRLVQHCWLVRLLFRIYKRKVQHCGLAGCKQQ